jgi:plasmid stabilization system protein ParE
MSEFRVELSPRARAQFVTVQTWWIENRRAAPGLFVEELEEAMRILSSSPNFGAIYRFVPRIRRVLLPRTRYHLYCSVDDVACVVRVLAIRHASRGSGPRL